MTLVIPTSVWQTAVEALRRPPYDFERIVYLDGPRANGDVCVATTLTVPKADQASGNFRVSAKEMSRAGKHLRRFNLMRLAQIHTHPAEWVGHSDYDDSMAFSQRDGAISIVVPQFARCAPSIADCGVHVREPAGWAELSLRDRQDLIAIVPSLIQLVP